MARKLIKALKNPYLAFLYFKNGIKKKLFLKKIIKDGEVYFKYGKEVYPEYLFRKKASSYIKDKALRYCRGRGIDVGAGAWPLEGAIPIENVPEENAYKLDRFRDNSLDFVFSSHCLEHLDKWQGALSLWIRKIKPGGILFLYLPHESMKLWRPGEIFGMAHVWSPKWEILVPFLEKAGLKILEYEKNRDRYWSFHIIARKR